MPGSPSKHRKALNKHTSLNPDRLKIRVVPYSPPRLSSDGSASSRPVSYAACSPSPCFSAQDRAYEGAYDVASSPNLRVEPGLQTPLGTPLSADLRSRNDVHPDVATESEDVASPCANSIAESPPLTPVSPSPSNRRANRVITVNSDKTFILLPQAHPSTYTTESLRSPRRSSTAPSSSIHRTVSDSFAEEQPSSPLTTLQELSQPCSGDFSPLPSGSSHVSESSSPWNYQFIGGLRKVPNSASQTRDQVSHDAPFLAGPGLKSEFMTSGSSHGGPSQTGNLTSKRYLQSYQSTFTLPERTNHRSLTDESPCPQKTQHFMTFDTRDPEQMSVTSTQPNIEVIGESSSEQSSDDRSRPETSKSNCNYLLHQNLVSSSPAVTNSTSRLKTEYSSESLVVAPLRPGKRCLTDQAGLSRQRSRDSSSDRSLTSVSSAFIEDVAKSIFAGTTSISVPPGVIRQSSTRRGFSVGSGSRSMKPTHHQWSMGLSTVVSESDRGSGVPSLRLSHSTSGDLHREHTSHAQSMSPDFDVQDSATCTDCPQPAYFRNWTREANSSSLRLIGDQDEHGDGLAELGVLHQHPSRIRLHSYLSNFPSDRIIRSAGSSRSNSFSHSYIPTWARLYYGSGERRLSSQQSTDSLYSEFSGSAHRCSMMSRCPSLETSKSVAQAHSHQHSSALAVPRSPTVSKAPSDNGIPIPYRQFSIIRRMRKQTSSIWSPHLRQDNRAQIFSLWRPPSTAFATREDNFFRDRVPAVLFVLGFVFPFAWFVASFLPLPICIGTELKDKDHSTSHLDLEQGASIQGKTEMSASRYDRAKWWRNLNRYMSIIGVFVIGAVLALTITGAQQQWKS
ncbi:hypothetical protein C2857_002003 [Epichloe festucae Fl1]|uniref:Serine-rich protein n=1 Tax=Epichloe festucae (strain Fl1) TaxID=877507 RepID=A0A7S9PTV3_EPIFF|nr:hypothetical protein C2857_002003 [Epichloe festucae Fl1]